MSEPLKVAVVGAGHLGTFHARILDAHPACTLGWVVDSSPEKAERLATELGCASLTSITDLPADLDAVSVAVPTAFHADVATPLLERGVACLVEKPLASTVAEADRMIEAARRGGAALSVGHVERFQPGLRKVRAMGMRPRFIECHRLAPFSFRSMDIGVVHDLMIHDLDLILHLMGTEIESIDAAGGKILTDGEDMASVRLVFADGGRANVTASRASLSPMRRFRMFSSDSYVSLDFHKNYGLMVKKGPNWDAAKAELKALAPEELAKRNDFVEKEMLEIAELPLEGEERPLQAEIDSFVTAVRDGRTPEVTGEDGRRALELADRIVAAISAQVW